MSDAVRLSDTQGIEHLKPRLRELRGALARKEAARARELFQALDRDVPDYAILDEEALLANLFAWSEEDFALAARIHSLYARMAEASQALAHLPAEAARVLEIIAAAVAYWSSAVKWELISGSLEEPQRFAPLHALFARAVSLGGAVEPRPLTVNGTRVRVSIEGLYVRALVLRRLSGGHLGRRQIEILDSWVLAWMTAMRLTDEDPAPRPRLVVQGDSDTGLLLEARMHRGPVRFLPLDPLLVELDRASVCLQQGELFPGRGPAATFRLEEHIALLDSLHLEFTQPGASAARRDRTVAAGLRVPVHVGLAEVIREGFVPVHPAADAHGPRAAFEPVLARPVLELGVRDYNLHGLGLLATRAQAATIHRGDLLGVRLDAHTPCVICEVVRKIQPVGASEVLLGTRVVSREALPLRLKREGAAPGQAEVDALFIPGVDSCGRADSLLVSEAAFQLSGVLVKDDPQGPYRLTLNRSRRKGRGWVLAGLEFHAHGSAVAAPRPQ
jgi:hypothetical protein